MLVGEIMGSAMWLYDIFTTPVGTVGIVWHRDKKGMARLARVFLPQKRARLNGSIKNYFPMMIKGEWRRLRRDICKFLKGQTVDFSYVLLFLEQLGAFQKKVYSYERHIPRGTVICYQHLAKAIGRRTAARAVGQVQAANPFPLVVPCHRVIKKSGEIGRFSGGDALKVKLLAFEGVPLYRSSGRIFVDKTRQIA